MKTECACSETLTLSSFSKTVDNARARIVLQKLPSVGSRKILHILGGRGITPFLAVSGRWFGLVFGWPWTTKKQAYASFPWTLQRKCDAAIFFRTSRVVEWSNNAGNFGARKLDWWPKLASICLRILLPYLQKRSNRNIVVIEIIYLFIIQVVFEALRSSLEKQGLLPNWTPQPNAKRTAKVVGPIAKDLAWHCVII